MARSLDYSLTRRAFLLGGAGAVAGAIVAPVAGASERLSASASDSPALWRTAFGRGLVYGSSTATWQISDLAYRELYAREAGILFPEDDMLWYRIRPTPTSELDFRYPDRIVGFAEQHGMLVFGAHLVWDEGFGDGWTDDDLWGMDRQTARTVLFSSVRRMVERYRGRVVAWSVANEVIGPHGLRRDVPWYSTIGPSYVAQAFHVARRADPNAMLVLNEYGFEADDAFSSAARKRRTTLRVIDSLLRDGVPVDALGIQAHLVAGPFLSGFDPIAYRGFLAEVASRGLKILITEMDVKDNGLPADIAVRDRRVAECYRRYLDIAFQEPAVVSLMTFGLSDRYTWLQEDYPRPDGARRRPLPFDAQLRPKPAFKALQSELSTAPMRAPFWIPPRAFPTS
ncbi:MAG TPA: endo-1,4-beta-xylanase [Actinomycetota bacterium]